MRHLSPAFLTPVLLILTGCALTANQPLPSDLASSAVQGSVYGGQQPVAGSLVSIYAAGTTAYGKGATLLASTTTDANGNFNFATGAYTCPFATTPIYLTAKGGNAGFTNTPNIMLAAGVGSCSGAASLQLNVNEVSTAATAFALSHFFTTTLGSSSDDSFGGTAPGNGVYNAGLVMANQYTIPAIASLGTGTALPSTSTVTREQAKLYTVANIIAACVNTAGGVAGDKSNCGTLFANTTPPGGATAPTDTLQAAVQIALYPYQNVASLYTLPPATAPFIGLSAQPNDFTLGISYTASNLGLGIRGGAASGASSNIDIDANGRVWFPTNTATAHGLAFFDPSTDAFNGPYITTLVAPQYLAIDNSGGSTGPLVYGTDLGSSLIAAAAVNSPATIVTSHGLTPNAVVGPVGITANSSFPNAPQYSVTASDGSSAIWILHGTNQGISSTLTNAATGLAPYNNPQNDSTYYEAEAATSGTSGPCSLEAPYTDQGATYNNQVIVQSASPCVSGGVAQVYELQGESVIMASSLNQICSYIQQTCFSPAVTLNKPQGVAVDGDQNLWIANSGNASISTLMYIPGNSLSDYVETSPVPYVHNSTNGNTITTPYGIAIDRSGNVWASNAGCVNTTGTLCTPGSFVLSELIGAAAPTPTPLFLQTSTTLTPARPQQ